MGDKCKYNQIHGPGALLLGGGIYMSSMGKISAQPGQKSTEKRLQSRNCFLSFVHPAKFPVKVVRCSEWQKRLKDQPQYKPVLIDENLATGQKSNWTTWRCLNRLRTGKHAEKNSEKMVLRQRRHDILMWTCTRGHQVHAAVSTPCTTLLIG